jgi:uncharacterized protein YecE (DUF72 family)
LNGWRWYCSSFPKFVYEADKRRYLDKLLAYFKEIPATVELRTPEWYINWVIEGMRERRCLWLSMDMLELKDLPPLMDTVTAPFSYASWKERETWQGLDEVYRFDYLHQEEDRFS